MKKLVLVLALFSILCLTFVSAYTNNGSAAFCTDCSDCTSALSDASYHITYLTAPIPLSAGFCINDFTNNNVVFDCTNYSDYLSGDGNDGNAGVYLSSARFNITIRNCNFSGYASPTALTNFAVVFYAGVENLTFYNNTVTNSSIGVGWIGGRNNTLSNNYFDMNYSMSDSISQGSALIEDSCTYTQVRYNTFKSSTFTFGFLAGTNFNYIFNNSISDSVTSFLMTNTNFFVSNNKLTNSYIDTTTGNSASNTMVIYNNTFYNLSSSNYALNLNFNNLTIANNTFNFTIDNLESGIKLNGVNNTLINNNIFQNIGDTGIKTLMWESSGANLFIKNNQFVNDTNAIILVNAQYANVTNNSVILSTEGILSYYSQNGTMLNNNINVSDNPFLLYNTTNLLVQNNTASGGEGVDLGYLSAHKNLTFFNNTLFGSSIGVNFTDASPQNYSNLQSNNFDNNTANNGNIYYFVNKVNTVINGSVFGFIILLSCSNITVKDISSINNFTYVYLYNLTNSLIYNNSIISNFSVVSDIGNIFNSINLVSSTNNSFQNNTFNILSSINLVSSTNNSFQNNTFRNLQSINFTLSNNNTLNNNLIFNLSSGLIVNGSNLNVIQNNTFTLNPDNLLGFITYYSNNNIVYGNNFTVWNNNTLTVTSSKNNNFTLNTFGNVSLFVFLNTSNNSFVNNSNYNSMLRFRVYNASNDTIMLNNVIGNETIDGFIINGSSQINMVNNTIHNFRNGIMMNMLSFADNISGNNIYNNTYSIYIPSSNHFLSYNTIQNSSSGIRLDKNNYRNTIFSNLIFNNGYGIESAGIYYTEWVPMWAPNNVTYLNITNNIVYNNTVGIVFQSDNNSVINNTVYQNAEGIAVTGANNNISDNKVKYNRLYGLEFGKGHPFSGIVMSYTNVTDTTISNNIIENNIADFIGTQITSGPRQFLNSISMTNNTFIFNSSQIAFDKIYISSINGSELSDFNYTAYSFRPQNLTLVKVGNTLYASGDYSPGMYSFMLNITDYMGNNFSRRYYYFINSSQEKIKTYYLLAQDPGVQNQVILNSAQDDLGTLNISAPTGSNGISCSDSVLLAINEVSNLTYPFYYNSKETSKAVYLKNINITALHKSDNPALFSYIWAVSYVGAAENNISTDPIASSADYTSENAILNINKPVLSASDLYKFAIGFASTSGNPTIMSNSSSPGIANFTLLTYNQSFLNITNISAGSDFELESYTKNLASYNIQMAGSGYANISINMPNATIKYDGASCNSASCSYSTNNDGSLNITVKLGSEHNLTLSADTTAPTITFSCTPTQISIGGTVTCSCSAVDDTDASPVTLYTLHPSTTAEGTKTTTCTATDASGNSATSTFSYSVINSGVSYGGGSGWGSLPQTNMSGNISNITNWANCNASANYSNKAYLPTTEQIHSGYITNLNVSDQIWFRLNNTNYLIRLIGIGPNFVKVSVDNLNTNLASDFNLRIGEAKGINMNNDSVNEFYVKLLNLKTTTAMFMVKDSYLPSEASTTGNVVSDIGVSIDNNKWYILAVVVLALAIALFLRLKKKKK